MFIKKHDGFTLLEVLVAVTILAVGMLSILSLHNQSIRMIAAINEQTDAAMAGRIEMTYLKTRTEYDAFEVFFFVNGTSYTLEEAFRQFRFESTEEKNMVVDVLLQHYVVSVINAVTDKEIISLEHIR